MIEKMKTLEIEELEGDDLSQRMTQEVPKWKKQ